MRLADIAAIAGGVLIGDGERTVVRAAKIEDAGAGDITFLTNPKYAKYAETTSATALIVDDEFHVTRTDLAYIRVADPYRAFLKVLAIFVPESPMPQPGVHPSAVIGEDVHLAECLSIGPNVVIGRGSSIGTRSVLAANVVIGNDVTIGEGVTIEPNVSIYDGTEIGNNVLIHAGTVIGSDGFGFLPLPQGGWEKIRQIGKVVIEDDVEIGANSAIDRGTLGETRIGRGVKIDNLVHVAHNVSIGALTAIAAQSGISGSTRIGEANMIAGQVGIVGHIETAANVIIEAQSGVSKTIRKAGRYFGHPAKEHSQALRQEGALRQLPELLQTIREMRDRLRQLEAAVGIEAGDPVE